MSKFVIDLSEQKSETSPPETQAVPEFGEYRKPKKRSRLPKILRISGIILAVLLLTGVVGGYLYWQSLKRTPQYSLALLVDSARREDQKTIDELVDTDAVVDDFMPQIIDKAVELYGRGLPRETIQKVAQVAAPLIPGVKNQARAIVPALIRDKTQRFENVPFWAIVLGAGKILDIRVEGDKAFVKSNLQDRPLEVTMKRSGDRWQIVGVKDEELARKIAEKIGQQIIEAATKKDPKKGKQLGVENLDELLKQAKDIFRQ